MSIESFFLINQLMDFMILAAAARAAGAFRPSRVYAASLLGAAFALLPGSYRSPPAQAAMLFALCLAALPAGTVHSMLASTLSVMICASAAGGLGAWAAAVGPRACVLPAAAAGAGFARIYIRERRAAPLKPVPIVIANAGREVRVMAIVDTGNRLHEPLSGQPVLIAEARAVAGVLPESGFRRVAYGSVGGRGTLRCFRPDGGIYILCRRRPKPAPEAWVALYPHRLPGEASALAPAEFAL